MKRWLALALALLLGLCPLTAAADQNGDESPVPEIGMEEMPPPDGRHFDSCSVTTSLHLDGTVSRTIEFHNSYVRDQAMRAQYGEDLESLLSSRAAPFGSFDCQVLDNPASVSYGSRIYAYYHFHISHAAPEQVLEFTAAVLQSGDNELELKMAASSTFGCVALSLAERFDLSQCLDEENKISCEVYVDIWGWSVDSPDGGATETAVNRFLLGDRENSVTDCTLIAPFERVTVTVGARKDGRGEVSLAFTPLRDAAPVFGQTALEGLRKAARELAAINEEGEEIRLTFAGTPEEISRDLNAFVGAYLPEQDIIPYGLRSYYSSLLYNYYYYLDQGSSAIIDYISPSSVPVEFYLSSSSSPIRISELDLTVEDASFTLSPVQTADRFKSGQLGSLTVDLRPVFGSAPLILQGGEGTELVPEVAAQFGGSFYSDTRVDIRFIYTETSLAPLPLILLGSLLILAGIALLIWRFKDIRRLFAHPVPAVPATPPQEEPETQEQEEEEPITFRIPEIYIADGEEEMP